MAFVNEYISEGDINKYGIEKTWLRYNAQYIGKSRPAGFRFQWTIDRERDVYLMMISGPKRDDQQDYTICIFYWHGVQAVVNIRQAKGGSPSLNDSPFRMLWELVNIPSKDLTLMSESLEVFKEALAVYGYDGARRQIANTIVEFNF